jgi:hypothetical protein
MSILLRSGKEQAMFGGDVLRYPVQLRRPRMELGVMRIPEQARASATGRWTRQLAGACFNSARTLPA